MNIRHILFPVDFSGPSLHIVPAVQAWADRYQASVTLLHVHESTAPAIELTDLAAEVAALRAAAQRQLDAFPFPGPGVDRVLTVGRSVDAITGHAASRQIGLIMMPTHGYSRFRQLLLGSVVSGVLHDCEVPVWTSAHAELTDAPPVPTRIVCAVDCGPQTAGVLAAAASVAEKFNAKLHVVHAHPAPGGLFANPTTDRAHRLVHDEALAAYAALNFAAPLEIYDQPSIVAGVTAALTVHNADLLIIGRGTIHGLLGRLRSNAHDLIRSAPCPVLSV